jgi:hypothetical protein
MKLLLDVRDDKATHLMEVLKGLRFVKTKQISPAKAKLLLELKEAVEEINLVKKGKKKAGNAEAFVNGL